MTTTASATQPDQQSNKLAIPRLKERWHSLRYRLIALLSVMLVVTIFVIGTTVLFFIYRNEQQSWQGRQAEAARYAATTVSAFILRSQNMLTLVSLLNPESLSNSPELLDDLLAQSLSLLEVVRLDPNGNVFAGTYRDAPLLAHLFTTPQARWFIESKAGRVYMSNIQISADSEPYLIISVPANDGGVVAARLRMNVLWEVVADLHFGDTGQAYVVNHSGQIIAHTRPQVALDMVGIIDYPEANAFLQTPGQRWIGGYENFEGIQVVGVSEWVPDTDWVVIAELPQAEAFATTRLALILLGGGMIIFGLLVAVVTSRFLSQGFLRPMEKLQAGVERIGHGDLAYRINIDRQDEVGQVAVAFNEMAERLSQRDTELATKTAALTEEVAERRRAEDALRVLNEELEVRVFARTTELQQVNTALQEEIADRKETETKLLHTSKRQALLYHVLRAINGQIEVTVIAGSTVEAIVEVTGWAHVCFSVPIELGTHWVIRATGGHLQSELGQVFPIEQGMVGRVFRTGQTQLLEDVSLDEDYLGGHPALKSSLTVPIMQAGRVLAVLNLEHTQPATFGVAEQQLAESLAEAIALALENARLFEAFQIELAKRQEAQAQISASLDEKVILLKEIHHRVKNNLQIILSLLDLQANQNKDQHILEMFKDSQNRVKSMALIHEQLYQSDDLSRIDFAHYLNSLVSQLRRSYNTKAQGVGISLNASAILLTIEAAIPCGLIVNELVSNAFKYAFPPGHPPPHNITIELDQTDPNTLALSISDNGVGIPADIDINQTKTLGLRLVKTLVKQIQGNLQVLRNEGTRFVITFALYRPATKK